jgi:CelD/BcsL family acetyltransferase involved in cellulose biosynthesis
MKAQTPTQRRLQATVLTEERDFAALEEEWEDLYEHCPSATPFQSWAWLYSWWESYGGGYGLRLIVVREGALLVGLLPLMLERRWGFGQLIFVGKGATDCLDVLVREGWEEEVGRAATEALKEVSSWAVTDLQELRPQAATWEVFRDWEGSRARLWQSNCPVADIKPWDELIAALSKNHRSSVRRSLRRAEEDGLRPELAEAEDAEAAAKRLVVLHRELWQERSIGVEHTTRRFEAFVKAAAGRMTARGLGGITEFRRDGEVVISNFSVFGRDFIGYYLPGASQGALKRYQFVSLCIREAVNIANGKDLPHLNFLRGEEPYKLRWSSRLVPNYRLILSQNPIALKAYARYHLLRAKGEAYASADDAPPWISKTVDIYRALRLKASRQNDGASK